MADSNNFDRRNRDHIRFERFREPAKYKMRPTARENEPRRDDHAAHAASLIKQLTAALGSKSPAGYEHRLPVPGLKPGTVVEITTLAPAAKSKAGAVKIPTTLEFPAREVVVLRSERNEDRTESALLFVPDDAREFLIARVTAYGRDSRTGKRPDVERFEVVEEVHPIDARTLFTGDVDLASSALAWWELWLRQPNVSVDVIVEQARAANIEVHESRLRFPESTIIFVHGTAARIAEFAERVPGAVTEIRRSVSTIEPFLERDRTGVGQHEWVADLAARIISPPASAPVVCTLDTGVAAAHPLIAPGLRGAWAYDAAWGTDDHDGEGGHGTPIAGLVLYGDLELHMAGTEPVELFHGVESMKLLPPPGFPPNHPPNYGWITQGAVSSVEVERPNVARSFCLACSTTSYSPSRPSTWSGALDQIAAGAMPGDASDAEASDTRPRRLFMVATGNVSGGMERDVLPLQPIEDPAQSWNALSIGGFTRKDQPPPAPPTYKAAVAANHRSPYSRGTTSLPYDLTPIKPEVLFEAGNMLSDNLGFCAPGPSVSLLAAGNQPVAEPLVPFWATSAAVGLAGNFIGRLQAARPDVWPETLRALTVDSARWPQPIRSTFIGKGATWKSGAKTKWQKSLREFGYGVPDIERAIFSAQNDATLIAEAEIQPFAAAGDGRGAVFNEMHFYNLPWPREALEALENDIVMMKVTLSYFIEPNLTGKAATRPETYRSFGLRFAMKRVTESDAAFRSRITAAQERTGSDSETENSKNWLLGPKAVQAGSLHCDLWRGRAIDLAGHNAIAVFPVSGWWKSHVGQMRMDDKARYSLVISISAPGLNVDLHSEIAALVEAKTIEVSVG
jgi:hypothetical protein